MVGHEKKSKQETDFQIRKLKHKHEAQICAQMMINSEPWITLGRTYEEAVKRLTDPSREVYLAVARDEIIGFIIIHMQGTFTGYIQTIAINPEWRNKGVGSRLIAFAEKRIFSERPNVFLCVSSFNKKAQKLYRRLGYQKVGALKDFIVSGHSEILLRKTIGPLMEFRTERRQQRHRRYRV
jgi:ribosomal protein S18 acetylase RimI-like enzyme